VAVDVPFLPKSCVKLWLLWRSKTLILNCANDQNGTIGDITIAGNVDSQVKEPPCSVFGFTFGEVRSMCMFTIMYDA
jgi:hypothetical protein